MKIILRKPILIGGVGLSLGFWLWGTLEDSFLEWGEMGLTWAIAVGGGLWWWKRHQKVRLKVEKFDRLSRQQVDAAIAQTQTLLTTVHQEAPDRDFSSLQQAIEQLPLHFTRTTLQGAIAGGKSVGKTALREILTPQSFPINWQETTPLFTQGIDNISEKVTITSDLVLLIVTGDLTDSEFQFIQQLRRVKQRVLIVLNQLDRYLPQERENILEQLRQRVFGIVDRQDVLGVAASPSPLKVRKYQDNTVQEWLEVQQPQSATLSKRLQQIIQREPEELVGATAWREAIALQEVIKTELNQIRRTRALPIIEKYQWIAAGTAFANPVPALDLLAAVAINGQMLVDLGQIYEQSFDLERAQIVAGTLGKLLVQLGVVEISTQAIATLLKSHAATYLAGGAIQGVSAAYFTHLAGLSLIEYFQTGRSGSELNLEWLKQKIQTIFQENQKTAFLQTFVRQTVANLKATPQASTS